MTNTNELTAKLKAAAVKASVGDWIKESGDGWDAICSSDDQANGGFIIAHFEGPHSAANREFVQAANPANILALAEALEAAEKRIASLTEQLADCREIVSIQAAGRREMRQRIAELETRTLTADGLQDSAFRHGLQHGFSFGQTDDQAGFEQCMEAYGSRGKDIG